MSPSSEYYHVLRFFYPYCFYFFVIFGFFIGFKNAGPILDSISESKLLKFHQILGISSLFQFAGAVTIGEKVSETIRTKIINKDEVFFAYTNVTSCFKPFTDNTITPSPGCPNIAHTVGSLSSFFSSSVLIILTSRFKLPISSTQCIVGSIVGYGLASVGLKGVLWVNILNIISGWIISIILSGILSGVLCYLMDSFIIFPANLEQRLISIIPLIYGAPVFMVIFSIFFNGSELLCFNKIPAENALLIALIFGLLASIISFLYFSFNFNKIGLKRYIMLIFFHEYNSSDESQLLIENIKDSVSKFSLFPIKYNSDEIIIGATTLTGKEEALPLSLPEDNKYMESFLMRKIFEPLQIMNGLFKSFAHGGNNIGNIAGSFITIWIILNDEDIFKDGNTYILIFILGITFILVGFFVYGLKGMESFRQKKIILTPLMGFYTDMGSLAAVLFMTKYGFPVSTTYCHFGSIIGVEFIRNGWRSIDLKWIIQIMESMFLTLPVSGSISACLFFLFRLFDYES